MNIFFVLFFSILGIWAFGKFGFALLIVLISTYLIYDYFKVGKINLENRSTCPHCQARGTFIYMYATVKGDPDLRCNNNPIICSECKKEINKKYDNTEN